MRRLASTLVVLACLAAAPAAVAQDGAATGPQTEIATEGTVSATLSYDRVNDFEARDVRLSIVRAGVDALVGDDLGKACRECSGALPVGALADDGTKSVLLRDLTGDGEPEVLVDLYTGGAHCCSITAIYGWDGGTSAYRRLVSNWGDPGYAIKQLGGAPALVTADARFAYAFCAYACSAMPGQVLRYEDFALVDVTAQFPARIRAEVRRLRRSLRQIRRGPADERFAIKGILPALCADLHLLGRGAACRAQLRTALRRGEVASASGDIGASGRRYVRQVLRFLRKTGYRS